MYSDALLWDPGAVVGFRSSLLPKVFPDHCSFFYEKKKNHTPLRLIPIGKNHYRYLFIPFLDHTHSLIIFSLPLVILATSQITLVSRWRIPKSFGHFVLCPHHQFYLFHFISNTHSVSQYCSVLSHPCFSITSNTNTNSVTTTLESPILLQVFYKLKICSPTPLPFSPLTTLLSQLRFPGHHFIHLPRRSGVTLNSEPHLRSQHSLSIWFFSLHPLPFFKTMCCGLNCVSQKDMLKF